MSVSPIRPLPRLAGLLLSLACLAAPVAAQSERDATPEPPALGAEPDDAPGVTAFAPTRVRTTPFGARVREAEAIHRQALASARARLASAAPAGRAAIQREIESLKLAHGARLAGLQVERARAAGRADLVAKLEQRIARLEARGARLAPAEGGAR